MHVKNAFTLCVPVVILVNVIPAGITLTKIVTTPSGSMQSVLKIFVLVCDSGHYGLKL